MAECIEQRKTSLTDAVAAALRQTVARGDGWGIELDVVQVAQVYIHDGDLRRQLEAGVRNEITSTSELSKMRMEEGLRLARAESGRKQLQETLETDRERTRIDRERLQLEASIEQDRSRERAETGRHKLLAEGQLEQERMREQAQREHQKLQLAAELDQQRLLERVRHEQVRIEAEAPVRLLELDSQRSLLELLELQNQVRELQVQQELTFERRRQELRQQILPQEQIPEIARALSQMFQGAQLSFVGEASPLMASLTPLLNRLAQVLSRVELPHS
jgi:hypothetical protein